MSAFEDWLDSELHGHIIRNLMTPTERAVAKQAFEAGQKSMMPRGKVRWDRTCGAVITDREVPGSQKLGDSSRDAYKGPFFICESATVDFAKAAAHMYGFDFVGEDDLR